MKARFLFPHRLRMVGMLVFLVGLAFFIFSQCTNIDVFVWHNLRSAGSFTGPQPNECFDDELQLTLITVGLLLVAFTKEKIEDEQIAQLRLDSLQWAVYVNYAVFIVIIFAVYGLNFLFYSMFNVLTLLIFFIIRFRWVSYKLNIEARKEVAIV